MLSLTDGRTRREAEKREKRRREGEWWQENQRSEEERMNDAVKTGEQDAVAELAVEEADAWLRNIMRMRRRIVAADIETAAERGWVRPPSLRL